MLSFLRGKEISMTTDLNHHSQSKELILIADDEKDLLTVLGEYLRLEGYRTAEATNGEEALALAREIRPDLVLLDIRMPKRNGFEVCQALKGEEATRDIPVIMVTAADERDLVIRGFEVGTDEYLIKPIHLAELLARVRSLLQNRRLREQLKQELTRRARAAHELRTPLMILKGYHRLLLEGSLRRLGPLNQTQRRILEESGETLDRLTSIVNGMLGIAGIQENGFEVKAQLGDLLSCLRGTLRQMQYLAAKKGLGLKRALPAYLPAVPFDRDRITQVMINLLDNAIKFTDEGWIKVDASVHGNRVLIGVEDTGKGMEGKEMGVIFEEFGRAKIDQEGCGLGLYISKKIVEAHGGKIWASSTPGQGSRFTFSLPLERSQGS